MEVNKKYIKYFLNGKEVDKKTIADRKDKQLSSKVLIEEKYYKAPLNDVEKTQKIKESNAASDFFRRQSEFREDQEKFH